MNNKDNEEFKEMDNRSEEISTRARSEAEQLKKKEEELKENQNNKNKEKVTIVSMKVVVEQNPENNKK